MEKYTNESVLKELRGNAGLLPVSIDLQKNQVRWIDFEGYHFYESFFYISIDVLSALKKNKVYSLVTDIDILEDDAVIADHLYPTGFIFHASRCGSTMLSKVLSRSRENHVISEAGPLNSIWQFFAQNNESPRFTEEHRKKIYRNLLLAMGRRRNSAHKHYFVKFTSFNIHFFEFIHALFPGVPGIFLSRNSDDIIRSFDQKLPDWLQPGNDKLVRAITGSNEFDPKRIVEGFIAAAKKYPPDVLKPFDYEDLKPEILPVILRHFNVSVSQEQLALMQTQFLYDSKVEFNQKKFDATDIGSL